MEWGLWHIIIKAEKVGKVVNVEPSIGKSRKHPRLSQNVLAFGALYGIMFIISVFPFFLLLNRKSFFF